MSNSLHEPRPGVQPPAGRGHPGQHLGGVQVGVGQRAPGQEPDGQPDPGPVVQHRRPDPGLGGGHRVGVLVVPVDAQQARPGGRDAHHDDAVRVWSP